MKTYCIVENLHPCDATMPRYMVVLHDTSVAASGYRVVVSGLTSMEAAQHMTQKLQLEGK